MSKVSPNKEIAMRDDQKSTIYIVQQIFTAQMMHQSAIIGALERKGLIERRDVENELRLIKKIEGQIGEVGDTIIDSLLALDPDDPAPALSPEQIREQFSMIPGGKETPLE